MTRYLTPETAPKVERCPSHGESGWLTPGATQCLLDAGHDGNHRRGLVEWGQGFEPPEPAPIVTVGQR